MMTVFGRLSLCLKLAVLVSLAGLLAPGAVYAADPEQVSKTALAVSPAILENVLDPGAAVPFEVRVANSTNFPLPIKATVRNFSVQSEQLEKTQRERLDASAWYEIDEPDFILQPRQIRTVKGVIRPPGTAVPGGHYATIFFQPLVPQDVLSPSTVYLSSKVGVLSLLIVKGDITHKASYSQKLQAPGIVRHGPIDFKFAIKNTGNVHVVPSGSLAIYDRSGNKIKSLPLPQGLILPDSTKQYKLTWDNKGALGPFRAELKLQVGDELSMPVQTAEFWIVPWLEWAALGLGSLTLGLLFVKTHRRWGVAWRALRGKDIRFRS